MLPAKANELIEPVLEPRSKAESVSSLELHATYNPLSPSPTRCENLRAAALKQPEANVVISGTLPPITVDCASLPPIALLPLLLSLARAMEVGEEVFSISNVDLRSNQEPWTPLPLPLLPGPMLPDGNKKF